MMFELFIDSVGGDILFQCERCMAIMNIKTSVTGVPNGTS